MKKPKVIAVVGPTASGKTALAIEIAKRFNGEVISADSRQVYRGLDIGTGKVTRAEMQEVTHHLLDIVEVTETYTAADFAHDAKLAIGRIVKKERLPIIAGGTFFYLDQLRNSSALPAVLPNEKLRQELNQLSAAELFKRVQSLDPARAKDIDPHNKRRLLRALEIIDELGHVPAPKKLESQYDWLTIGIKTEKELLRRKFQERLENWLRLGLEDEVRTLLQKGLSAKRLGEIGFEYLLAKEYVEKKISREEFVKKFIEKNWQYAKRQMTWLKRDKEIVWFSPTEQEDIAATIEHFLKEL